jgi:ADP-ribose pyrophosphatase YjhB (NUDIX family)
MISFTIGDRRFDLRAAAIVLHDGRLLLHRAPEDDYWVLPGGRVEMGETGADAIVREMHEEIGEHVECGRLVGVVENFFMWDGLRRHALELYYATRFAAGSPLLHVPRFEGVEAGAPLLYEWFAVAELDRINVRPRVVRRLVVDATDPLPAGTLHLVQRDESAGSIDAPDAAIGVASRPISEPSAP